MSLNHITIIHFTQSILPVIHVTINPSLVYLSVIYTRELLALKDVIPCSLSIDLEEYYKRHRNN